MVSTACGPDSEDDVPDGDWGPRRAWPGKLHADASPRRSWLTGAAGRLATGQRGRPGEDARGESSAGGTLEGDRDGSPADAAMREELARAEVSAGCLTRSLPGAGISWAAELIPVGDALFMLGRRCQHLSVGAFPSSQTAWAPRMVPPNAPGLQSLVGRSARSACAGGVREAGAGGDGRDSPSGAHASGAKPQLGGHDCAAGQQAGCAHPAPAGDAATRSPRVGHGRRQPWRKQAKSTCSLLPRSSTRT